MYALYSAVLSLVLLGYLPTLAFRGLGRRGYRRSFAQRWGRLEPGLPTEPRCWIHAVSVGEAAAAVPLVAAIADRWPQLSVVMSTVTPTGARIVADRLGSRVTHRYFPLDLPGPVRRGLDAVRPRFFIGLETELWPNFFRALASRGIPAMVANGRISDRSFRRYRLVRRLVARMLRGVSVFAMQSAEDARRIIALGAPPDRVVVTGNLKVDLPAEAGDGLAAWRELLGIDAGRPLWIAGSTHQGEEAAVVDAYRRLRVRFAGLRLLVAPRHPERVEEVERIVRDRGLPVVRRTELGPAADRESVVLLDTVGELAGLYGLADVVFVGGSLVPVGGHNVLEPAQRRKAVVYGPHTSNFRESAELLESAGAAVVVRDAHELSREIERLLESSELRDRMGEAGFAAVTARRGALGETLALVERYLIRDLARAG
ncbi:MAG TPA: 3-deoxy-D-manno-octulosonic acid transferase [Candidatus Methylomirabilis sp.]|nr:3-deoxy-D-manno-octulosonic acid transferase [Candidatus Methylomirabilis sp.]